MSKCHVAKVTKVEEIEGARSLQKAWVLGDQVLISKDVEEGHVGLFFPADTQLSYEFAHNNNLHRHSNLNKDVNVKGFFEDNRKVKAQTFIKEKSEGFFCELSALDYIDEGLKETLSVGDTFQDISGQEICKKFISEATAKKLRQNQQKAPKQKMVETPLFHQHVDTDQFRYWDEKIPKGTLISIHAKVHGTSARYSHSKVVRKEYKKNFLDKLLGRKGTLVENEGWEYLVGTRRVTRFEDDVDAEGFHGSEEYRFEIMEELKPYLSKGMTVYGEIAGYANGKPIMAPHYTDKLQDKSERKKYKAKYGDEIIYKYGCKEHEYRFHIYRITITNEDGKELDFTDQQVNHWCECNGFLGPIAVTEPFIYDGDIETLRTLVEDLTERKDVLGEDLIDPSHLYEGVIVRVDRGDMTPKFLKNKNYIFKVLEGIAKEQGVDEEDAS